MHETTGRLYQAALEIHNQSGQSAVARLLNESPQTVKNWESRGVSKQGAIKIEQQLGVRANWLLTGHGPMHTQTQVVPIPSPPRLEDALAVVAQSLASVPPEKRQVLLGVLATYSSNPAAEGNALDYLQRELAQQHCSPPKALPMPSAESADIFPPVPSAPGSKNTPTALP